MNWLSPGSQARAPPGVKRITKLCLLNPHLFRHRRSRLGANRGQHFDHAAADDGVLADGHGAHEAVVQGDEALLEVERPLVPEDQSGDHFERHKGVNGPGERVRFMPLFLLDDGRDATVFNQILQPFH